MYKGLASSKIHVGRTDTMNMEHSHSGIVCDFPNNILRYAAATLTLGYSLVEFTDFKVF